MTKIKTCSKCKKELPATEFFSGGRGNLRADCKVCHRQIALAHNHRVYSKSGRPKGRPKGTTGTPRYTGPFAQNIKNLANLANARAKRYGDTNKLRSAEIANLFLKQNERCGYCSKLIGGNSLGIDHIIPFCKSGKNVIENIVGCCAPCNAKKQRQIWTPKNDFQIVE